MSYKAAMISLGSVSSKWTVERMRKYFDRVDELDLKEIQVNLGNDPKILYHGRPMQMYDCVIAKGSFRYALVLRALTSMLDGKCFMPIEQSAFTIGHNKILTQMKLQKAGIPTPATYLATSIVSAKTILEELTYPIIIKFPEGTQGKGVMFADSYASASSMLDAFATLNQTVLIQEYIETGSTDTRAIVVGDKVVAAMQRKAEMGEKRANIHAGGVGERVELDPVTKRIAVKTAKVMKCGICAVDMLEGVKGPSVIEINLSPGLQGITQTTKIDVADKIARYLYEGTKNFKSDGSNNRASDILKDLGIDVGRSQDLVTNLALRGEKMILPAVAAKIAGIDDDDEVIVTVKDGEIKIRRA